MSRRIIQHSTFLKALYHAEPIQRKIMIESITNDETLAICDIASKILRGRINMITIHWEKLKDYKRVLRSLACPGINVTRKKRTLLAFHTFLPLLIKPVLHLLDEV